ncbi:hypothetical protein [Actinoplanes sp. NPDC049118]|uniref:hypothetical protein n=1 Tax=Actinoplanes sp. NPDC049118 TaxID=3155769 RepID=UPI0034056649
MSAMDAALRVMIWATDDARGPAPTGALSDAIELAAPPPVLRRAVARLAAVSAAQLMLDAPPLGGPPVLGCEAILVAAAVGVHRDPASVELLRAAGRPSGGYDLLARHAVAAPAVREGLGSGAFRDALLDASPLTALLDHPRPGRESGAEDALDDFLLPHPQGRVLLVRHFGRPPESPGQSRWRGGLLQRLRPEEPELVLDVYESAISRHRPALVEWVRQARRGLGLGVAVDRGRIEPVAKWWQALSYLERGRDAAALRTRFGLTGYSFGLELYRTAWRLGVVR